MVRSFFREREVLGTTNTGVRSQLASLHACLCHCDWFSHIHTGLVAKAWEQGLDQCLCGYAYVRVCHMHAYSVSVCA